MLFVYLTFISIAEQVQGTPLHPGVLATYKGSHYKLLSRGELMDVSSLFILMTSLEVQNAQ